MIKLNECKHYYKKASTECNITYKIFKINKCLNALQSYLNDNSINITIYVKPQNHYLLKYINIYNNTVVQTNYMDDENIFIAVHNNFLKPKIKESEYYV